MGKEDYGFSFEIPKGKEPERKQERINMMITASDKQLIQDAARKQGISVTELCLSASLQMAKHILGIDNKDDPG